MPTSVESSTQDPAVTTPEQDQGDPTPELALEAAPSRSPEQTDGATPEPATSEAPPDGTADPAAQAPATPSLDLNSYSPPPGGTPLTFRVDRMSHAPDGALAYPTGVWIPKGAWERQVVPNLANRQAWQHERGSLHQRASEAEGQYKALEAQHAAVLAEVDRIFSDPDKAEGFFQNWQVDGPRLRAEMDARATKAQLDQYRQRDARESQQQQDAALLAELPVHLGDGVAEILDSVGVTVQGEADRTRWREWVLDLCETFGPKAFFSRDTTGQVTLDEAKVERLVRRELERSKQATTTTKAVARKVVMNAAAVAPTKAVHARPAVRPAATPRDETGKFTREDPDDWERNFMKTQFHKNL